MTAPIPIPALPPAERIEAVWSLTDRPESDPGSDSHALPADVWALVQQGAADPDAPRYAGDADRGEDGQWPTS